jgi:trans-2,3-dihydro-3-hydroxyanthranilate isomerase
MKQNRRSFLGTVATTWVAAAFARAHSTSAPPPERARQFPYVQIDVFSSRRLEGNPLAVFTDARGLSDEEMQALARETNLSETTFVFPRDAATEQQLGVQVRIFTTQEEVPFAGHPTLGTAMVLRKLRQAQAGRAEAGQQVSGITLDLKIGKVPVDFREPDPSGNVFGEMHQVAPMFGPLHDRETVAKLLGLHVSDLVPDWPIQTVSTGLPFAIVPIKQLSTLQSLRLDVQKVYEYLDRQQPKCEFYYVTRDTGDPDVGLRSRLIFPGGEDPATGSAAGCTAAWMVRYGIAQPEQTVHIQQGVEMKRASQIFVRASKDGDKIANVRVGGHAVQIMQGTATLNDVS